MVKVIETQRFYLREFEAGDAEDLFRLNNDPEVIKYTGNPPFVSVEEAAEFVESYDHYRSYGYGRWAVIQKSDADFLGWCGLKFTPGPDECDIGYRLFRSAWGRGVATETARACIHHGFNVLGLDHIVGRALKDNIASISVLQKIGMKYSGDFEFFGSEAVLYVTDKLSWQTRR
jgi:RimJ/RimL family protein N-acetyltransferase